MASGEVPYCTFCGVQNEATGSVEPRPAAWEHTRHLSDLQLICAASRSHDETWPFSRPLRPWCGTVTVLQRHGRFCRAEAARRSRLAQILTAEGVALKTGVKIDRAGTDNGKDVLSNPTAGRQQEVEGDEILLATGKIPNTAALVLDRHRSILMSARPLAGSILPDYPAADLRG
jgi:hypothetical protein